MNSNRFLYKKIDPRMIDSLRERERCGEREGGEFDILAKSVHADEGCKPTKRKGEVSFRVPLKNRLMFNEASRTTVLLRARKRREARYIAFAF